MLIRVQPGLQLAHDDGLRSSHHRADLICDGRSPLAGAAPRFRFTLTMRAIASALLAAIVLIARPRGPGCRPGTSASRSPRMNQSVWRCVPWTIANTAYPSEPHFITEGQSARSIASAAYKLEAVRSVSEKLLSASFGSMGRQIIESAQKA